MKEDAKIKLVCVRWLPGRFNGMVLGNRILMERGSAVSTRWLAHELAHVDQWRRLKVFFLVVYAWQWLTNGRDYHRIPLEIEAQAAAEDPAMLMRAANFKTSRTEVIRACQAK